MSQPRDQPEPFVRHGDQMEQFLVNFWQRQVDAAETDPPPYGRHPPLPLARIKKVMKSDPDVRMIASDAPILFCKACEIFIQEITCRAFLVADAHKRRTISKADIAKALAKSDHFDFLIDVVPRDEAERAKTQKAINSGLEAEAAAADQANVNVMGSGSQHQLSPTTTMHPPSVLGAPGVYQPPPPPHLQQMGHMMQPPMHPQPPPMHHRTHSHSHSHSQGMVHQHQHQMSISPIGMGMGNQPPPLIPNARGTGQVQGQGMSQSGGAQQPQQGGNGANPNPRRASVSSRMSLSPTIPLSSSRMEPPSSL